MAIELALHGLEDRLPEPVLWGSGEVAAKVAQVQQRATAGRPRVDILILGPSHASVGISPQEMAAVPGFSYEAYNGALNGRTYPVLEFLLNEVYGPALDPEVLVLAASPIILNRYNERMERNTSQFFDAPMPRALVAKGIRQAWDLLLVEHVNLYRYRKRQAGLTEGCIEGGVVIDPHGFRGLSGCYDEAAKRSLMSPAHPYQEVMRRYEFGGPSAEALIRIIEKAKGRGQTTVVVNMPFRPELLAIGATGKKEYQEYLRQISRLQEQYGFIWLDYQERLALADQDFRDVDHLNTNGTRKLSVQLARDLVPVLSKAAAAATAAMARGPS